MKAKRKVLGPHGGAGSGALHPLHPLRALHGRGGQGAAAGRCSAAAAHELIDIFPGKQLDSNYSGNTVDICPVGALLNRDFRFRARALVPLRGAVASAPAARAAATPSSTSWGRTPTATARARTSRSTRAGCATRAGSRTSTLNQQPDAAAVMLGRGEDRREATRRRGAQVGGRAAQAAGRHRGPGGARVAGGLERGPARGARLRQGRARRPRRCTWAAGRRAPATTILMTRGQEPQPQGPGVDRPRAGADAASRSPSWRHGDQRRQGQGALRDRRRGAGATRRSSRNGCGRLECSWLQAINESADHRRRRTCCCPRRSHVEDEGTFIQLDGHHPALPRGLPGPRAERGRTGSGRWRWRSELGRRPRTSARDVFRERGPQVPELASFDWDGAAPPLKRQAGHQPAADRRRRPAAGLPRVRSAAGEGNLTAMRALYGPHRQSASSSAPSSAVSAPSPTARWAAARRGAPGSPAPAGLSEHRSS